VVVSSFVVPGGVCIILVRVLFSTLSLSAHFGGILVHCVVLAFGLLESISL